MKKLNKVELTWFVRWSSNENKYKRYIELYDEIENLKADLHESNDSITWWQNRFNSEHIEVKRLKELLKENSNKEKVIIAQDNIIKEVREYIETHLDNTFKTEFDYITTNPQELLEILDKVGSDKE